MSVKAEEADGNNPGDAEGADPGQAAATAEKPPVPGRRSALAVAAERRIREEEARAPEREAARLKALQQAREARGKGVPALIQLIMGHPLLRQLVTPVDGRAEFALTEEEADELFRRDFKLKNGGKGSQPNQRRRR